MLEKLDKAGIFFRYIRTVLRHVFRHMFLQKAVITFLTDDTFPTLTPTKEEIKNKTDNWEEK